MKAKQIPSFFILIVLLVMSSLVSCRTHQKNEFDSSTEPKSEQILQKKSIFQKLKENDHLSVEDRIALYHDLKATQREVYNFEDEGELNKYGYWLLQGEKVKEAIEIFKLLVAEFPTASNPYDSLGEAYLKDGNEALALVNYEKSVELNPKNTHAIDQITILKGLELLVTDWGKEFFHFPLHFAPEIPYSGVEEVVFPKNWRTPDSSDFWSYVFVWELDDKTAIEPNELEETLKLYFDGLMAVVNKNKDAEVIKTSASFRKNEDPSDSVDLLGELKIFDAFATNAPLDLHARVFSRYCEERKKLIVHFQFSPKEYDHSVWDLLRTVKIRKTVCQE